MGEVILIVGTLSFSEMLAAENATGKRMFAEPKPRLATLTNNAPT